MYRNGIGKLLSLGAFCLASMLGAGGVSAAVVDGKPAFAAGRDAGVYVWREGNGDWQMRLLSGSKNQEFNGGFSVKDRPFNWTSNIATEGGDSVRKTFPGQIEMKLKVGGADFIDGVTFGIPAGAGVCLWGGGTTGKTVYLGADATQSTMPVDLLGNGACGKSGASTGTSGNGGSSAGGGNVAKPGPQFNGKLKYNPGHYIALNDWDGPAQMIEAVKPGVRGLHKRYPWKDLEPTPGNYNFSLIARDLQIAQDHGMQLVVMIEDKSFSRAVKLMPPYLANKYAAPYTHGGWVSTRWDPYVVQRMAALTKALGARFDSHPNLEGISFQESAMGFTPAIQKQYGYTPERYRDALIQQLTNTRQHFPTSQVFWYQNYLEGKQAYIGQVLSAVEPLKIAMGGPDILPDSWQLNFHSYPFYKQFKGRLTLFGSMQYDSYKHVHATKGYGTKYWTPAELFQWARNNLHVNYVFWTRKPRPEPADSYSWQNALPVIRNNSSF